MPRKRRASARVSTRIRFARLSQIVSAGLSSSMKDGRGAGAINDDGPNRTKGRSKARKNEEEVVLKAGGLSGRSFKDKFKPIGMAYAPLFRLCLAIFVSVPLPSSLYRLILASLPLLFFGLIVVNRPFKLWWMTACNACLPCLPK